MPQQSRNSPWEICVLAQRYLKRLTTKGKTWVQPHHRPCRAGAHPSPHTQTTLLPARLSLPPRPSSPVNPRARPTQLHPRLFPLGGPVPRVNNNLLMEAGRSSRHPHPSGPGPLTTQHLLKAEPTSRQGPTSDTSAPQH